MSLSEFSAACIKGNVLVYSAAFDTFSHGGAPTVAQKKAFARADNAPAPPAVQLSLFSLPLSPPSRRCAFVRCSPFARSLQRLVSFRRGICLLTFKLRALSRRAKSKAGGAAAVLAEG